MKKYIFLTSGISEMGGSEMFTSNKVRYLKEHDWDVEVFFFRNVEKVLLDNLKTYIGNNIPELYYSFSAISGKKRNKIISRICKDSSKYNEFVVESHLMHLTHWGEIIAKLTGGKHILNCMEENITITTKSELDFIEFKLKRNEILNAVNTNVLKRYFGSNYKSEYESYLHDYLGKAICSNVTQDIDYDISYLEEARFNILSLGRLDKPYVMQSFNLLKEFFCIHQKLNFNLIIIGGSPQGYMEEKIDNLFIPCKNVKIYNHGYMFPIPLKLLRTADIGIAMANSVDVMTSANIPTINIDIHDLRPIGYYGITTKNKFVRGVEDGHKNLIDLLEYGLNSGHRLIIDHTLINEPNNIEDIFKRQLDFLKLNADQLNTDHKYYDIKRKLPLKRYIKTKSSRFIHKYVLKDVKY